MASESVTSAEGKKELFPTAPLQNRSQDCSDILSEVQKLVIPFIHAADEDAVAKVSGQGLPRNNGHGTTLVASHSGPDLTKIMNVQIPRDGKGADGLLKAMSTTLKYSVNTWDRGFMDKLYASTDAPGIAAELFLASLNTNVHVYTVSPALTVIEKAVTKVLAGLFGLKDEHSGGVSVQGGAASNLTSIIIARNVRYPEIKSKGMGCLSKPLVLFTSQEAHYSISTAAASLGLGTDSVCSVPVDEKGCMNITKLEEAIESAIADGKEPFYVSATAGTTVRGAYDPLSEIGRLCQKHNLWFHIDAAWGGAAVFSSKYRSKLDGSHLADSIAFNAHKMMSVPTTCSFLLGKDLTKFYAANSLSAGYLFHGDPEDISAAPKAGAQLPAAADIYDLASFTPQCGRRGDSLKLYLSLIYHGIDGYEKQIDAAFDACQYMAQKVKQSQELLIMSDDPPPCCQCCFYYRPQSQSDTIDEARQTKITRDLVAGLVQKGWMIDYAPGQYGEFLRVVTNRGTSHDIVDGLMKAIHEVGRLIVKGM